MKLRRLRNILLAVVAVWAMAAQAAIPDGYYKQAEGLSKQALLTALEGIVGSHTEVSYSGLWRAFSTTDVDANGKIIDMYSDKRWPYSQEQCGNYSHVGDCYNREHSMPKSWFNDATPMYSDLFHLYPTDGRVNGQRSNDPFGECANGTRLSYTNEMGITLYTAKGKSGASTYAGYTGTVWEPDDEYKGDFARTYFYMAAAYNSQINTWATGNTNLGGTTYPVFNSWSETMLMEWHRLDPVSDKEIARNEAVYSLQGNRNPFIDHPEMAEYIWGNMKDSEAGWSESATATPQILSPSAGMVVDFGEIIYGANSSQAITVIGENLTLDLDVYVMSNDPVAAFTIDKNRVTAAEANAGRNVIIVTFEPQTEGSFSAILRIVSNEASVEVPLQGSAYSQSTYIEPTITVEPQALVINAEVGQTPTAEELVVTSSDVVECEGLSVSVNSDPAMEGAFAFADPTGATSRDMTISANCTTQFYVQAPAQTTAGTYEGTIYVGCGNYVTTVPITYIVSEAATPGQSRKFRLVTSADELAENRDIIIVSTDLGKAVGAADGTKRTPVDVTVNAADASIDITDEAVSFFSLTLGKQGGWGLYESAANNFLSYSSATGNHIDTSTDFYEWAISFTEGNAAIVPSTASNYSIQYNASGTSPMFRCYKSGQKPVQIYQEVETTPSVSLSLTADKEQLYFESYVYEAPESQTVTFSCAGYGPNDLLSLEIVNTLNDDDFTIAADGGATTAMRVSPANQVTVTIMGKAQDQVGAQFTGTLRATLGDKVVEIGLSQYVDQYIETVEAPTALAPGNLQPESFTARWTAVDNADHYVLEITEETEVVQTDDNRYNAFTERFAGCTGTGGNDNVFSGISTNKAVSSDNCDNTGWSFYNASAANGCVSIGTSRTAGTAMTPVIDGVESTGRIIFCAGAWSSDATTIQVTITSPATSARGELTILDEEVTIPQGVLEQITLPYESDEQFSSIQVKFAGKQASKNRFFLDDVIVEQGEDNSWTDVESDTWEVNNLTDTSYTFTHRQPGTHYSYRVKAVTASTLESEWSNAVEFDTPTTYTPHGDINSDTSVDGSDVSALLEMVLSGGADNEAADINGDGSVDGSDVSALLEMVLSGGDEPAVAPLYIVGNVNDCEWTISKAVQMTPTETGYEVTVELNGYIDAYFTFITSRDYGWLETNKSYRLLLGLGGTEAMTVGNPVSFQWPDGRDVEGVQYLPLGTYRFVVNNAEQTITAYAAQ